ncbi:MAG TPA: aspartate kinase, partial [Flavisolibacter sp.]|nr:aspartate kinase [Flavisolibacter sp.]
MQVLKFGGSSVANAVNIKKVKDIIEQRAKDKKTIVVASALGGITDNLLQCGELAANADVRHKTLLQQVTQQHLDTVKELLPLTAQSSILSFVMQQFNEVEDICNGVALLNEFSNRTKDRILSYGELISSKILSAYLTSGGLTNTWIDARKLIITDSTHTKAAVQFAKTEEAIVSCFSRESNGLFIVPGFISADENGYTTTLGRGGSDYTAAIIGAALQAEVVEIWTDVSGMMTADPRLVNNARHIEKISYHEAMELSHFGAKVIYPPTIQPLMNKKIPVWIKNTFAPEEYGTIINGEGGTMDSSIRGISSMNRIALLSLEGSGMVGIPGFSKRLFEALANNSINVILITQASSEHSITVGVEESLADKAKTTIDKAFSYEIAKASLNPLVVERGLAIIALVGDNMKNHPGISGRMFGILGRNGVNVRAIAQGSSERNISAVLAAVDIKKAVNVLHEEFFETTYKQVNLFIAGTGNVGSKLLAQIKQQQDYLQHHLKLQFRIAGLTNSRKMVVDEAINAENWKEILATGEPTNIEEFIKRMKEKNLRNSVFVDVTANDVVAGTYNSVFEKSISVVACNKIACSSPYNVYKNLKDL